MPVTYNTISTTGLLEISEDHITSPSQWGFWEEQLVAWLGDLCDVQLDVGGIISGSGYQDGVYNDVTLVRSATTQTGGNNMKATVTITGGGVSNVEVTQKGNGFLTGDYLIIPDLAQVGGTGAGFQIPVSSHAENIGLIAGPSDRNVLTNYPVALQLGVERTDSFPFGTMLYRTSSTTTTYMYDIYRYVTNQQQNDNGYGGYTVQQSNNISMWTDSNGDNATLWVMYCNEPGNQFWFCGNSTYDSWWGVAKCTRPANGQVYPPAQDVSEWTSWYCTSSSVTYRPLSSIYYTTAYTGTDLRSITLPSDSGILFNGFAQRGRSWLHGFAPDRLHTHSNTTKTFGHVYQEGAETYRRMTNVSYMRMN